jgi:hypothetical protein
VILGQIDEDVHPGAVFSLCEGNGYLFTDCRPAKSLLIHRDKLEGEMRRPTRSLAIDLLLKHPEDLGSALANPGFGIYDSLAIPEDEGIWQLIRWDSGFVEVPFAARQV